jgi:hypothetical protein
MTAGVSVTLRLDAAEAEYLLERLGGPAFLDSTSSDRERADAVSYDCIVGQLERGLEAARKVARLARLSAPRRLELAGTDAENEPTIICSWFALCDNDAAGVVAHSILGTVPTCQRCVDTLGLELIPY